MFRKYTREGATHLAKEYCRRSHYFFMRWLNSDDEDFQFTEAVTDEYQEQEEWLEWVLSMSHEDPCFDKVVEMRSRVPVLL